MIRLILSIDIRLPLMLTLKPKLLKYKPRCRHSKPNNSDKNKLQKLRPPLLRSNKQQLNMLYSS